MALHRLTAAAAAGVLVLGLAGCGGDPKPSASSSTPTPTASVSPTGPVAPVLPELAKRKDAIGAKAFVRYWFAAVTYAMKTGDSAPMMAVSGKECETCVNLRDHIAGLEAMGKHLVGGGWTVLGIEHDPQTQSPYYRFAVKVRQEKQRIVNRHGKSTDSSASELYLFYAGVQWQNGHHLFHGLERIDD